MPTGRLELSLFLAAIVAFAALVAGIVVETRGGGRSAEKATVANGAAVSPAAPVATSATRVAAAPTASPSAAPPAPASLAKPKGQPPTAAKPSEQAASPATAARAPTFTFAAARGDSWLLIRAGSSTGKLLYQGTLTRGRALRYSANRLWVRFGAATNVDVRVGGGRVRLPYGTADVIIRRSGLAELVALG